MSKRTEFHVREFTGAHKGGAIFAARTPQEALDGWLTRAYGAIGRYSVMVETTLMHADYGAQWTDFDGIERTIYWRCTGEVDCRSVPADRVREMGEFVRSVS